MFTPKTLNLDKGEYLWTFPPIPVMQEKTASAFQEETEKQKRLRIGSHRL